MWYYNKRQSRGAFWNGRTAVFGLIAACAGLAGVSPAGAQAIAEPDPASRPAWLAETIQLESIAYAIGIANAGRCGRPSMATGLILHELGSYDARIRPAIASRFGLGMGFGVLGVVAGSGADHAGLRAGDEITDVDGINAETFGLGAIGHDGSHDRTTQLTELLDARLRNGAVSVQVRNHGEMRSAVLAGLPACGGRVAYIADGPLNAWSDGSNVAVTAAMIHFTRNDQELAFVVAHEMAHNLLHHADEAGRPPAWLAMLGIGTRGTKRNEIAADDFAVDLLDHTRFDARMALPMIWRTAPFVLLDFGLTHPGASRRVSIIEQRLAQLRAKPEFPPSWFEAVQMPSEIVMAANTPSLGVMVGLR